MTDGPALHSLLDALAGARVLCLGDVMLDRFIYGQVQRISAEAPIPVLRVADSSAMLGGAGNVARNVAALGARVTLVAAAGDDAAAEELQALAAQDTGTSLRLVLEPGRTTTVKSRYIAAGQQLLRADEEVTGAISDATAEAVLAELRAAMAECDVVVLSDYAKGLLTDRVIGEAITLARNAGKPVIVDPKRADLTAYRGAAVLTPNRSELAAATGADCDSDAAVEAAARGVIADADIAAVLVTRSERGSSLVQADGAVTHLPTRALEVFDVSGAGDTVVATLAVALAAGADLEAAAQLANAAGGVVVGKVGTAAASRDDLAAALLAAEAQASESKVVSRHQAAERVAAWRAKGLRIGFTNGCFDLLHPGHVLLVQEAKAGCDRLVVAINSDASTRRLKGPERPIQDEAARALVLASLQVVDLVVIFEEDTPVPLLELFKPDILFKGGDYALDQVVGADVVRDYGGEVRVTGEIRGMASSVLISRMAGEPPSGSEGAP